MNIQANNIPTTNIPKNFGYWDRINEMNKSTEPPVSEITEIIKEKTDKGINFLKPATAVLLLLMVAVSGNFTAELLGCNTQKILSENMIAKHMVLLSLIYFTMDSDQFGFAPHERLLYSLLLWVFFILYTHQTMEYTIISTAAIITIFVINDYIKIAQKNKKDTYSYELFHRILYLIVAISIVIGNFLYYNKQTIDYRNNFNFLTFIFGKKYCDGMVE